MDKLDSKAIYLHVKKKSKYEEEKHCLMVLDIIGNGGSVAEFCTKALISETQYYRWRRTFQEFEACSRIANQFAQMLWERTGEENADNPDFNWRYWEGIGNSRFNLNKQARIRLLVDSDADPHVQYQQLIQQAGEGDLTASEVKQLMESINIGIRAFESFKLQREVDKMREDLNQMNLDNADNSSTVENTKKTNKNTTPDYIC